MSALVYTLHIYMIHIHTHKVYYCTYRLCIHMYTCLYVYIHTYGIGKCLLYVGRKEIKLSPDVKSPQ